MVSSPDDIPSNFGPPQCTLLFVPTGVLPAISPPYAPNIEVPTKLQYNNGLGLRSYFLVVFSSLGRFFEFSMFYAVVCL
jgi:hypothetical protein